MSKEEFQERYASLVEHYSELTMESNPATLVDNWRWFQAASQNLLYEYNESSGIKKV